MPLSATRNERKGTEMTREHRQMITQQVLYGMVLPAAIYAVASHFMSTLLALVVASMLPVTDVVKAKVRGQKASPASLGFLGGAVVTSDDELAEQVAPVSPPENLAALKDLTAVDGSLLPALPRMAWALWLDEQRHAQVSASSTPAPRSPRCRR